MTFLLAAFPLQAAVDQYWTNAAANQVFTDGLNWSQSPFSISDNLYINVVGDTTCPISSGSYLQTFRLIPDRAS
jgi:hypothetical protein